MICRCMCTYLLEVHKWRLSHHWIRASWWQLFAKSVNPWMFLSMKKRQGVCAYRGKKTNPSSKKIVSSKRLGLNWDPSKVFVAFYAYYGAVPMVCFHFYNLGIREGLGFNPLMTHVLLLLHHLLGLFLHLSFIASSNLLTLRAIRKINPSNHYIFAVIKKNCPRSLYNCNF